MHVQRNIEARSFNHFCSGKAIRITYFECVCVCVCVNSISYPACNAHAPCCRQYPAPLYNIFPHYLTNSTIFEETVIEHKMCVFVFCTTSVWNISRSKNWARHQNEGRSSFNVPAILARFLWILNFLDTFSKNTCSRAAWIRTQGLPSADEKQNDFYHSL